MTDSDALMEMPRRMLRIRFFDDTASELVQRGDLAGEIHAYQG